MEQSDSADARSTVVSLAEWQAKRRSIFYAKTDIDIPDETLKRLRQVNEVETQTHVESMRSLCKAFFGTAGVTVIPFTGRGTFHLHYRVTLPSGQLYHLRVNALSHLYRAFELHADAWVMRTLELNGLPSLPVLAVDSSRRLCAFDYEITVVADGQALTSLSNQEKPYRSLVRQLGSLVAAVHGIATERFGLLDVAPLVQNPTCKACGLLDSWEQYVTLNLDRHISTCLAIGAIDPEEAERIRKTFVRLRSLLQISVPSLLHGDLANHNVTADGSRITAVLDWEDCLSGDPVFDIAYWATFRPHENLNVFLDGYREVRPLPPDFEMRFWLYYLRVSLSKTVHRHRFGYADPLGHTPASLRIQHSLERLGVLL
jgi:aminoglycoside phosphotransferase (APT) family kinase protein